MKVIVAGSRTITDPEVVQEAIKLSGFDVTELVHGDCRGVDRMAGEWAKSKNIPIKTFPAQWTNLNQPGARIMTRKDGSRYNINAGYYRNSEMAAYADALVAIKDKKFSGGTDNMISAMRKLGKLVSVYCTYLYFPPMKRIFLATLVFFTLGMTTATAGWWFNPRTHRYQSQYVPYYIPNGDYPFYRAYPYWYDGYKYYEPSSTPPPYFRYWYDTPYGTRVYRR